MRPWAGRRAEGAVTTGFVLSSEEILAGVPGAAGVRVVGAEVGRLRGGDEAQRVKEFLARRPPPFILGLHMPLFLLQGASAPPVLSADPERRQAAREQVTGFLDQARGWGAAYALFHFPAPPVLPQSKPSWPWRLTDWEAREAQDAAAVTKSSRAFCAWLEAEASGRGLQVYLEGDGPHPNFYRSGLLARLLAEHPGLGFCLNLGQVHLLARLGGFSFNEVVASLAPYTRLLHLNNSRLGAQGPERMVPVDPSQHPEEGWADVAWVLRTVMGASAGCLIKLEHEGVWQPARLAEGRRWAQSLVDQIESPGGRPAERPLRPAATPPSTGRSPAAEAGPGTAGRARRRPAGEGRRPGRQRGPGEAPRGGRGRTKARTSRPGRGGGPPGSGRRPGPRRPGAGAARR